jgi:hypothetical protein
MPTPLSSWIFWIFALAAFPVLFIVLLSTPWFAQRKRQRDILRTGQASIGTIVAMDEIPMPRGAPRYDVTVEFTSPDSLEPLRCRINLSSGETDKLGVYSQVAIHYKQQFPIQAVIDELVR